VSCLDVGSADINGNNRYLFEKAHYTGLDVLPGSNVDVVSPCHLYKPEKLFDTVISTECLEHDMHWKDTLKAIHSFLHPGGLFVFTCATTGRAEHGTRRRHRKTSLHNKLDDPVWADYYRNLTAEDILKALTPFDSYFCGYIFNVLGTDLRFYGFKTT
jgi:SAM-dependent methyltransferase